MNVGCGSDVSIRELTELGAAVVGFTGRLAFDATKPTAPRKLLDVTRTESSGRQPRIGLEVGVRGTNGWFLAREGLIRR